MTPGQNIYAMQAHAVRDFAFQTGGSCSMRALAECAPLMGPVAGDLMGYLSDVDAGESLYAVQNGIAVVPVMGSLVDRCRWIGSDWTTGYNVLKLQLETAFADPQVEGIVLRISSGGGMASGLFDFVDWALQAKADAGKPVVSICDEEAYSAAYAIALIGDSISLPQTGGVGSIGAFSMHWEYSQWLEKEGDTITIIRSGTRKNDGNSYEPLPDAARADFQSSVDALRLMFAQRVSDARGIDVDIVLGTEGRAYFGPTAAKEAVALGLADAIISPDDALTYFAATVSEQRSAA